MSEQLLNPRGVFRREEKPIAQRMPSLDQKVMGLVDNSKANADLFLQHIKEFLCKGYAIAEVLTVRKATASMPATFTEEFLDNCDFAVNAFGD